MAERYVAQHGICTCAGHLGKLAETTYAPAANATGNVALPVWSQKRPDHDKICKHAIGGRDGPGEPKPILGAHVAQLYS